MSDPRPAADRPDTGRPDTSRPYIGRFAPSPTARQHIGNLRTALAAWLDARSRGGRIILRIEDLDPARCRREFEGQIVEDYRALGLDWDNGTTAGDPLPRQSERAAIYCGLVDRLGREGRAYPCFCSRREIELAAGAPAPGEEGPRYPGTCRDIPKAEAERRIAAGDSYAYRFRTDDRPVSFIDLLYGPHTENVEARCGDFVVFRKDGVASYQLAVVADDHQMGITCVVRGADLLDSTARQIALQRTLGWELPDYLHVPLITGPGGRKFAKRERDLTLPELVRLGWAVPKVTGFLAHTLGLIDRPEPATPVEILKVYDRAKLRREPTEIDPARFPG